LPPSGSPPGFTSVGKIFLVNNFMYYPVVATVGNGNTTMGYVIRWRLLLATPGAIKQLAQIIGANGTLYFGNDDGRFWTDMIKPVAAPPLDMHNISKVIEYSRKQDDPLFATAYAIPNSHWLLLLEFSKKTFLETSRLFLQWLVAVGIVLIVIGSFITWLMSRNIIAPLKKLTAAAAGIAAGDYTRLVNINRQDELGQLAGAFNIMVIQVRNAQKDLEKKVKDRTFELENTNRELEAFSYSVSHDLHAPLRIIDGYAAILSEKSAGKLDDEGNKILSHIRHKTKRMGKLIDELLNLSYQGRKELAVEIVDMDTTVRSVIREQLLLSHRPIDINIKTLLPAVCDSTLIRQVWSNLISNAIKYSAKKERPCIEIDSHYENNLIVYCIKDNGVGFDMKYADKLFGVFQRLHGLKEFEGSGVGLALVQRVIVKHGGKVWAEAEEGKGAAFYFALPYADY
jgi:signal transduction histidine kinase